MTNEYPNPKDDGSNSIIHRIQKRLYSSNIVEKSMNGGKTWTPYIAPLCKKEEGDRLCEAMVKGLNI